MIVFLFKLKAKRRAILIDQGYGYNGSGWRGWFMQAVNELLAE